MLAKVFRAMRALKSRNYRLFFSAQGVSLTALWMQRVAMGWLVFNLTNSAKALGVIDFASSVPSLFLSPVAGALMTRWDLRRSLYVTQSLLMLGAVSIAICIYTGWISYPVLVGFALFLGSVNAFDMPIRQSLVVYMVNTKEDLPNAVALNSSLFNVARLIGPSVAGFVIYRVGEVLCFLINSIAYSGTLFALKAMRMERRPVAVVAGSREPFSRTLLKSIALLRSFPPFKDILLLVAISGIFCVPCLTMMPAMAREVLKGTSRTMGLLLTAIGAGALVASILMAVRKNPVGLEKLASRSAMVMGIFIMIFSVSSRAWFSIMILMPFGFCMVTTLIACNTFLQSLVRDRDRSRLMGLYIMATVGITPLGSLLAGYLADIITTQWALFMFGVLCTLVSYYYYRKLSVYGNLVLETYKKRKE